MLKTNFGDKYVFEDHLVLNTSICYYWKNGYPDHGLNKVDEEVVTIFIIRDLTKWLVSMYHNPFCLDFNNKTRSFDHFIQQKHEYELNNGQVIKKQSISKCLLKWMYTLLFNNTSTEEISNPNIRIFLSQKIRHHRLKNIRSTKYIRDHRKLEPLNYCDHNLTIFEIRYRKIFEYIKFSKFNNSIFLILDNLQKNEYCSSFLYRISDQFNLSFDKIRLVSRNLKTFSKDKNTKYATNPYLYSSLISKYENVDLENRIKDINFLKHV